MTSIALLSNVNGTTVGAPVSIAQGVYFVEVDANVFNTANGDTVAITFKTANGNQLRVFPTGNSPYNAYNLPLLIPGNTIPFTVIIPLPAGFVTASCTGTDITNLTMTLRTISA